MSRGPLAIAAGQLLGQSCELGELLSPGVSPAFTVLEDVLDAHAAVGADLVVGDGAP